MPHSHAGVLLWIAVGIAVAPIIMIAYAAVQHLIEHLNNNKKEK